MLDSKTSKMHLPPITTVQMANRPTGVDEAIKFVWNQPDTVLQSSEKQSLSAILAKETDVVARRYFLAPLPEQWVGTLKELLAPRGTICKTQTVVQVTYSARTGEPLMSGSNMSQVVLTNEDATMFEQVVQNVSEMFQEVLVDADWVLKSSEGLDVVSEETLRYLVDHAQRATQPQKMTFVKLRLTRGALKAFNKFDVESGMAYLVKDKYATMGAQQRTPKFLEKPIYEPLSLNQLLDKEIKGWQDMFGQKLLEAGKRLHIDPILCNALFLLPSLHSIPALNDLDKGDIGLRVEYPLKGAGSAGALDYAVLYLKEVCVMLEAKSLALQDGVGQLLAQMAAVRHKRKRKSILHQKVYGLLSNAAQWWFYACDPEMQHPVRYYVVTMDLTHSRSVSDVSSATRYLLEHLLGFLILCLKDATPN